MARTAGGMLGGAVGSLVADATAGLGGSRSGTPAFGDVGYLSVTETTIGLVRAKTGLMKPKLTQDVVARVPRSEVDRAELVEATPRSNLTIWFRNSSAWEFELTKVELGTAAALVDVLGPATPRQDSGAT